MLLSRFFKDQVYLESLCLLAAPTHEPRQLQSRPHQDQSQNKRENLAWVSTCNTHLHTCTLTVLTVHTCTLTVLTVHTCTLTVLTVHTCTLTVLTVHTCTLTVLTVHTCTLTVLTVHTCTLTVHTCTLTVHTCTLTVHTCTLTFIAHYSRHKKENQIEGAKK